MWLNAQRPTITCHIPTTQFTQINTSHSSFHQKKIDTRFFPTFFPCTYIPAFPTHTPGISSPWFKHGTLMPMPTMIPSRRPWKGTARAKMPPSLEPAGHHSDGRKSRGDVPGLQDPCRAGNQMIQEISKTVGPTGPPPRTPKKSEYSNI